MGDITISKPTNLNGGEAPCGKSACENHEKKILLFDWYI